MRKHLSPLARDVEILRPVFGNFYIAQNLRSLPAKTIHFFQLPDDCKYLPYCDDFGPMNLASLYRFNRALRAELESSTDAAQRIVFKVDKGRRPLSNAVFLVGAYMILELSKSVDEVVNAFSWLDQNLVEGFRDATYVTPEFDLSVSDCWRGLAQGVHLGWIGSSQVTSNTSKAAENAVDLRIYEHFDNPLNGDLHVVVPGKFVAFAGPTDLPDEQEYLDDSNGYRRFSPKYYARIFAQLGVTDVVQLNFNAYDVSSFASHGITVHQLPFPDCTCPTEDIVDAFLRIVDGARGLVAVHCRAGLGRTGTLIARHMMRSLGFGARQAIAWLRIMRSGSVIGPQQQYLCAIEPMFQPAKPAGGASPLAAGACRPDFRSKARRLKAPAQSWAMPDGAERAAPVGSAANAAKTWKSWLPGNAWRSGTAMNGEASGKLTSSSSSKSLASKSETLRTPSPDRGAAKPRSAQGPSSSSSSPIAAQVAMGMAARGAARVMAQISPPRGGNDVPVSCKTPEADIGEAGPGLSDVARVSRRLSRAWSLVL